MSVILIFMLFISQVSSQNLIGCGIPCNSLNTCPGQLECRFGRCADNPIVGTLHCVSNTTCKPTKSVRYEDNVQRCDDCCTPGKVYNYYSCSPPFAKVNRAWLYATRFTKQDGGIAQCTQLYYNDGEKVVSLSTGWFQRQRYCLQPIQISANNRSVIAKVVDECGSDFGCNERSLYRRPCRPDAVGATEAVWAALGVNTTDAQYGKMDITWTFQDVENPPNGTSEGSHRGNLRVVLRTIVGIVCGALLFTIVASVSVVSVVIYGRKRAERKREVVELRGLPRQFRYRELVRATKGFTVKLGEGGFGSVFYGKLVSDGSEIGVKCMQKTRHGDEQFKAEVMSIGSIHHVNLIKLRGFCKRPQECMLVYDYMPKGSLDKWIFGRERLDWSVRYNICVDVARGLAYLHEGCSKVVLHLDIKPQNILLDEQFRAKIADFGLSKLVGRDSSESIVTVMRGTPGYMAPEWMQSRVMDKTDVYSFGVVLLEIVTCTKMINWTYGSDEILSGDTILNKIEDGTVNTDEATRVVRIALWCISEEPAVRPSMGQVVKMLECGMDVKEMDKGTHIHTNSLSSSSLSTIFSVCVE